MRMQLPFTKSELVLLAVILAGAIGGTGLWLFATPDNSRLPDIGPEPTLVISKDVVGPVIAARIVEDREKNGLYRTVDDLQRVKGIGPATVAKIKDSAITEN